MRIYMQDREGIVTLGSNLWVARSNEEKQGTYFVIHNGYNQSYLGTYNSAERAKEVLGEIFSFIREGKETYVMPQE